MIAASHFSFWVDGSIVGLYILVTMWAGLYVRKYGYRVEDFLMAGREMNLYLASLLWRPPSSASSPACTRPKPAHLSHGFAGIVPGLCQALAMFLIGFTGFCVKPLRDSGAMTLPNCSKKRFGRFVRWLSGVVIVMGGLLNMGVFLKIGGDFPLYRLWL